MKGHLFKRKSEIKQFLLLVISPISIMYPLSGQEVSYNMHIRPLLADKCFACHGPDEKNNASGLRLDRAESAYAILKDSKARAIIPGKPNESEIWRRITSTDSDEVMPPSDSHLKPLTSDEKELIKKWILKGAQYEPHWAFIPIVASVTPPKIKNLNSTNPIDHFIVQRLNENGWALSSPAEKYTLLRRVSYDLTGLPPDKDLAKKFLTDNSSGSYERLVDALLDSPRYGEHWAIPWLEASRYADTTGFQHDWRWDMYPWRTWVIRALNANLPFDQFLTWQLAGDLLPNPTSDQILATAYNRLHRLNTESGALPEEFMVENTVDRVETVSSSLLGLTMGCARCHDHKYDPLSQREFFSFFAFFNSTSDSPTPAGFSKGITASPVLELVTQAPEEKPVKARVLISKELAQPRPSYILDRGDYSRPRKDLGSVAPDTPSALPSFGGFPRNRLGLARWLTARNNPLTSRVLVNRFWQELFGVGIVPTSEDFGLQGAIPSHPQLLDWLCIQWMENNWDTKKLLRLIVTSHTYRQAARLKLETREKDPKNRLLSYFPRRRLSGYVLRDQALSFSGLIHHHLGGRPVYPYQPSGMWDEISTSDLGVRKSAFGTVIYHQDKGANLYRRSIYTFWKRSSPPPTLSVFDAPNREVCSVRHDTTNTPLQALALLNDTTYLEAARQLAAIVMRVPAGKRVDCLMHHILKRLPTREERELLGKAYLAQLTHYRLNPVHATTLLRQGESPNVGEHNPIEQAAWM